MTTATELASGLNNVTTQIAKIGTEVTSLKSKVSDLETAITNGNVPPEVEQAFRALQEQVQVVDDLVPDATTIPTPSEPGQDQGTLV